MKNPINIAKRSYSELLRIDELFSKLDQISARQDAIEQKIAENNELLRKIQNNKSLHDKLDFLTALNKYSTDITKIPKNVGQERTVQDANFILYKDIAKILKAKHITFFVDFGILIGLIRHHDFVPWDDDVDITVPRTDYEKLPKIFDTVFKGTDLRYVESEIIRIYYKNTPLQLDIFPLDFYDQKLDETGKEKLKEKVAKLKTLIKYNYDNLYTGKSVLVEPTYKKLREAYHQQICKKDIDPATAKKLESTIIHSFESPRNGKIYILDYDDVFPLKEVPFLDTKVYIPHKTHLLLTKHYYGDYFSYPDDLGQKHQDILSRVNKDTLAEVERIVEAKKII